MPGGIKRDISRGLYLSHVNLFKFIFSAINDDPEVLKMRAPSVSIIRKFKTVLAAEGHFTRAFIENSGN